MPAHPVARDPSYLKARAHFGPALDPNTWLRLQRGPGKGQNVKRAAEVVGCGAAPDVARARATSPQPIRVGGAAVTDPGWGAVTDKDGEASSLAASMGSSVCSGMGGFGGDDFDCGGGAGAPASAGLSAAGFEARSSASLASSASAFPAVHSLTAGTLSRQSTGSRDTLLSYDTTSTGSGRWPSSMSISSRGGPPITATLVPAAPRLTTVPSSGSGSEGSSPTELVPGGGDSDYVVMQASAGPDEAGGAAAPVRRDVGGAAVATVRDSDALSGASSPATQPDAELRTERALMASRGRGRSPAHLPSIRSPAAVRARRGLAPLVGADMTRLGLRLRGLDRPLGTAVSGDTRGRSASDSAVRRVRRSSFRSRGGSANARSAAAAAAAVAAVQAKRRAHGAGDHSSAVASSSTGSDAGKRHQATPPPPVPRLRIVGYDTGATPGVEEWEPPAGTGRERRYGALARSRRADLPAVEQGSPDSGAPTSALIGGYASGSATVTAAATMRHSRGRGKRGSRHARSRSDGGRQQLQPPVLKGGAPGPGTSAPLARPNALPGIGAQPMRGGASASPAPSLPMLSSTPPPRRLAAMPRARTVAPPAPLLSNPVIMGHHVPSPRATGVGGRRSPRSGALHSLESCSSDNAEALADRARSPAYESQLQAAAWWEPSSPAVVTGAVVDPPASRAGESEAAAAGTGADSVPAQ